LGIFTLIGLYFVVYLAPFDFVFFSFSFGNFFPLRSFWPLIGIFLTFDLMGYYFPYLCIYI
jgi:hypothetical protein